ncbi:MAG: hypothetical protein ACT4O5_11270, partial [Gammaproteobacteria bacterium]
MISFTIVVAALVAALVAWIGARVLARTAAQNGMAIDDTLGEMRKIHVLPTSRIGGIALAAGVLAGAAFEYSIEREFNTLWVLILCAAPGFLWGLIEDVSKRGAV